MYGPTVYVLLTVYRLQSPSGSLEECSVVCPSWLASGVHELGDVRLLLMSDSFRERVSALGLAGLAPAVAPFTGREAVTIAAA
jgi:hypothetical protein